MVHQHPLAYLIGLEGVALLRAFAGEYDREFTEARLAEVRALLDAGSEVGEAVEAQLVDVVEAYRAWSVFYDERENGLFELDRSILWGILDHLAPGVALDAGCGTGRHAAHLASLGHRVIGVDVSPDMLARARAKVPTGEFHQADLRHLPLPDDEVDVAVCALALAHVPDLAPVLAEFARVLRPGGHLLISDVRGLFLDGIRSPLAGAGTGGGPAFLPQWNHLTSDYLSAAIPLGFQVRRCEEPRMRPALETGGARPRPGSPTNPATLDPWCPEAFNAACRDVPLLIVWDFQLASA